jgi:hypothetical protein
MDLESYITTLLLRYLRQGRALGSITDPHINLDRDLEYIRLNWSISKPIHDLCENIISKSFQLQRNVESVIEFDDVHVRGRIDAIKTILARSLSGYPNRVAYHSVKKEYSDGPNKVLAWVVRYSYNYARRWLDLMEINIPPNEHDSRSKTRTTLALITDVHKIGVIKEIAYGGNSFNRPNSQSLFQASRSRKDVYRSAYKAYCFLQELERGEKESIKILLEDTLLKPKEDYQILELALALGLAQGISLKIAQPVLVKEISIRGSSMIISIGHISISWQTRTNSYVAPIKEPSEQLISSLLPIYNLNNSSDRPDIIVKNENTSQVIAIGEAKSFKHDIDGWRDPLRQALEQIVRYSRGYSNSQTDQFDLIKRSVILLSDYPQNIRPSTGFNAGPTVFDITDILNASLTGWIDRILNVI